MATSITTTEVQRAATELARMRRSLGAWMRVRGRNDRVLAGTVPVTKPRVYAQRVIASSRNLGVEQDLATQLYALLQVVMPGQPLPDPDLATNPNGAVQLAQIAMAGGHTVGAPVATGGIFSGATPWLWPVLIVGAVFLTVTTAISSAADVAKDHEEKACIQAGACTDYGFWLKAGGIAMLAWLAWHKMGLRETFTKKGGS